jgi:polysaccharide export outer membrane protein
MLLLPAILAGATCAHAQDIPEWLEHAGEAAVPKREQNAAPPVRPPAEAERTASDAEPRGMETRGPLTGPFLEEYIVRPRASVETLGDRAQNAPRAAAAQGWIEHDTSGPAGNVSTGVVPGPADWALPPGQPMVPAEGSGAALPPEGDGSRYRVQPSDVLTISVWREPDLEREVTVSPDGWISYPLLGELHVENSTIDEISRRIESGLSRFVSEPAVSVSLRQSMGNRVFVVGNVNSPGVFGYSKQLDVMQALTLAGGVAKFADSRAIRILRRNADGKQVALAFDYKAVKDGRDLEQNIFLMSGDVVMVP